MWAFDQLLTRPPLDWAPRLTLIFLIAVRPWRQHGPPATLAHALGRLYLILLMAGLFVDPIAAAPSYWLAIVVVHALWLVQAYAVADNHRYLEGYWCLAIAMCLLPGDADGNRHLTLDATLLIGGCFVLAVLWKLVNPRFRDGSFLVHAFLFDPRFAPIAFSTSALTPEIRQRHLDATRRIESGLAETEQAAVPRRLRHAALLLAWWTIAIELVIAALFLLPFPGLELWRTVLLLVFAVTTYVLVPVPAFGHVLLIMLMVSTQDARWRTPILGLSAFVMLVDSTTIVPERVSRWWKKIMRRRMNAVPQFCWTQAAVPRRLERHGEAWQLVFPSAALSIPINAEWASSLDRLLRVEQPFSWNDIARLASGIPADDRPGVVSMLTRLKILADFPLQSRTTSESSR